MYRCGIGVAVTAIGGLIMEAWKPVMTPIAVIEIDTHGGMLSVTVNTFLGTVISLGQ